MTISRRDFVDRLKTASIDNLMKLELFDKTRKGAQQAQAFKNALELAQAAQGTGPLKEEALQVLFDTYVDMADGKKDGLAPLSAKAEAAMKAFPIQLPLPPPAAPVQTTETPLPSFTGLRRQAEVALIEYAHAYFDPFDQIEVKSGDDSGPSPQGGGTRRVTMFFTVTLRRNEFTRGVTDDRQFTCAVFYDYNKKAEPLAVRDNITMETVNSGQNLE